MADLSNDDITFLNNIELLQLFHLKLWKSSNKYTYVHSEEV